jgi:23S rRNA (adenine2503-C2)-methyltransferase
MTDLKKDIRQLLSNHFRINRLQKIRVETSIDGSQKYLFKLEDNNCVESILIPEKGHYTLCISSQVGCALGCRFCLTAKSGFVRNLTKSEIVSQVRDVLYDLDETRRLTNIVMMGMGEPLANFENVLGAIFTITSVEAGLGFSNRRVTLSTAGLVHKIQPLGCDTRINLAVSLNATDNNTRDMLMPINRVHPIETLLEACRNYPLQPHRRITFEYILIKGINDTPEHAHRLAQLLRPIRAKINLIAFNEHDGCDFTPPDESVMLRFQEILLQKNYTAIIRRSKGRDISAACGQLRVKNLKSVA